MTSIEICRKILELLLEYNEKQWVKSFDYFVRNADNSNIKDSAREILKIYGGAGSFNDLVLHKDGLPVTSGNEKLNQLKRLLYESLLSDIAN